MDEKGQPQPERTPLLHPGAPAPGKGYSSEDRQKIRAEWETGTASFKVLGLKYGINAGTIKSWSFRERWNRKPIVAAIKELIEEKAQETFLDRIARAGLPIDEFFKMVADGARETKTLKNIKQPIVGPDGQVVMSKKGRPVVADKTISVIDNDNTRKYRELYVRMAGLFAAPKGALPPEADPTKKLIPTVMYIPKIEKPANEPPIN